MFPSLTLQLQQRQDLSAEQMTSAMESIMSGQIPTEQLVPFLAALRDKGETIPEITAAARVMRKHSLSLTGLPEDLVDTCGTGGDKKGTFNISTATAFVAAGAGVLIAKHGNRSVSSKSGSADVLEALGIKLELAPEDVKHCLEEAGIAFLFARSFHPAMKHVAAARQELGTKTIFNVLGPLTNPAGAKRQVSGVFDKKCCEPLAQVLAELGSEHVMVVHGSDGMDELTLTGPSFVAEYKTGELDTYEVHPEALGLSLCSEAALSGEDARHNAHLLKGVLEGYESHLQDVVVLNAAAALVVAGRAADLHDGVGIAKRSIGQGHALRALNNLIRVSNGF